MDGGVREVLEAKRPLQCRCIGQDRVICELTAAVERQALSAQAAVEIYDVNHDPDCQGMVQSQMRPGECQPDMICGLSLGKNHLGMLAVSISNHPAQPNEHTL